MCLCVRACACVRACVRACTSTSDSMHVCWCTFVCECTLMCVCACMRACVQEYASMYTLLSSTHEPCITETYKPPPVTSLTHCSVDKIILDKTSTSYQLHQVARPYLLAHTLVPLLQPPSSPPSLPPSLPPSSQHPHPSRLR